MIHKTIPKKLKILQNGMSTGAPDVLAVPYSLVATVVLCYSSYKPGGKS
jgi:hypothetical protein